MRKDEYYEINETFTGSHFGRWTSRRCFDWLRKRIYTSGNSQADSSTSKSDNLKISVILNTLSSEYWGYVSAGAKAYGQEHGIEVNVQGPPSETSYDEQQNMIETTLTSGDYDGMVISALQADTAKHSFQARNFQLYR